MVSGDITKPRRIELILRQIDSLPTLPAIAARLLALTSSDDADAREVVELISIDPSLTAKVLSLCRAADKGVRDEAITIERAVVLLGFAAVRNAVLSVKVFEMFDEPARPEPESGRLTSEEQLRSMASAAAAEQATPTFNRAAFWRHSIAVASAAELIARAIPEDRTVQPDDAFVCGLLHDIGKLALDHTLPKSYARVIELAELNLGNIAEFERRIVGIDHHTAGKRLAEQWQLPHRLQDSIWLHGSSYDTLPRLEHRRLIGAVRLADLIARQQHIGYSGNYCFKDDPYDLARRLELPANTVDDVASQLHEAYFSRAQALGLDEKPSNQLLMQSIQQANAALGRLNQTLDRRSRTSAVQSRVLEAITTFHAAAQPARAVQDVLDTVANSARTAFGPGFYAILYPSDGIGASAADAETWLISQYTEDGAPVHSQYIDRPPSAPDLTALDNTQPVSLDLMGLLPWIADYLLNAADLREVRLLPLPCGWGTAAVLLHDRDLPPWAQITPLISTWGAAIAGATQHDGAKRLGEQLADSNRALAETQDRLLRTESMARLGEMAAGAAHEMNNPLAVISGRSQLLAMTLAPGTKEQKAAQTIFNESHRLSDLITCLHTFAEPPDTNAVRADLAAVLDDTVRKVKASKPKRDSETLEIYLQVKQEVPPAKIDVEQVQLALTELLLNAVQAAPKQAVQVTLQRDPGGDSALVQVIDDGDGMDQHTLDHALDPFFSNKPAGRRVGMGLPRAQQIISAHGGSLDLRSTRGIGTIATFTLPLDSPS